MLKRLGLCAAALLFAIGTATPAHAALVTFTTTGTFASSGTSVFTSPLGGVTISFTGIPTTVTAPSSITFGVFDTSGTIASGLQGVSDTFTMQVFQTVPSGGTGTFVGTLAGTLRITQSHAYVEFAAPLSIVIGGVRYTITEADGGHVGRAELKPPSSGGGQSTVEGIVSVPEPASALLLGLGFLGSAAAARRRRKNQA